MLDDQSIKNDSKQSQSQASVNDNSINRSSCHQNFLFTPTHVVATPTLILQLIHGKSAKSDQVPSNMDHITHDTSTEPIQHHQLDSDMAANQVKNVPDDI